MDSILYFDNNYTNLEAFNLKFSKDYRVFTATNVKDVYEILDNNEIQVLLTTQKMLNKTETKYIERIQSDFQDVIFMIFSIYADFYKARQSVKPGRVFRFLLIPWKDSEIKIEINNAIERYTFLKWNKELLINLEQQNNELKELQQHLVDENSYLKSEIRANNNFDNIISEDKGFLQIFKKIEKIADSDAPVLITGETGTGKELIARAIHDSSGRKNSAFVCVNCAAIPETLFESELFGHEKGAFTGAVRLKKGKFELANQGTLFLDEIGEIPMSLQPKLLRAIQEECIERIGGCKLIDLDFRIICATNRNLIEEIERGNFRDDLFYRINVFPLELPPLRKRLNDISQLVNFFVKKYNIKYGKNIRAVSPKNIREFKRYHWPGNVRELENIIERAVLTTESKTLNIEFTLPDNFKSKSEKSLKLVDVERNHILSVLEKASWKIGGKGGAAEILGLNRTTLQSRIKKLNIRKPK